MLKVTDYIIHIIRLYVEYANIRFIHELVFFMKILSIIFTFCYSFFSCIAFVAKEGARSSTLQRASRTSLATIADLAALPRSTAAELEQSRKITIWNDWNEQWKSPCTERRSSII